MSSFFNLDALPKALYFYYSTYFVISVLLACCCLFGLNSGFSLFDVLTGFILILGTAALTLHKRFQSSPFGLIFSFFSLLNLKVPITFIFIMGTDYIFGDSIGPEMFNQKDLFNNFSYCVILLFFFWFLSWASIYLTARKVTLNLSESKFKLRTVLLVGALVFLFTLSDNSNIMNAKLLGDPKVNSLLTFLFFDHAYLILAGVLTIINLNLNNRAKASTALIGLFLLLMVFSALMFSVGSKSAVAVIFIFLFFFPIAVLNREKDFKLFLPNFLGVSFFVAITPVIFHLAYVQRMNIAIGVEPTLSSLVDSFFKIDLEIVKVIILRIFYRLSHSGLDQFILTAHTFLIKSFNLETAISFTIYLLKNAFNLILPGSPFPDAYAPSSQIFPLVVTNAKIIWSGGIDTTHLLKSFNTQPYTIFGVFIVIFGWLSPIFFFLFSYLFMRIFHSVKSLLTTITLVYFYYGLLPSYGPEVVLGNSLNFFISLSFMYYLMVAIERPLLFIRTLNAKIR